MTNSDRNYCIRFWFFRREFLYCHRAYFSQHKKMVISTRRAREQEHARLWRRVRDSKDACAILKAHASSAFKGDCCGIRNKSAACWWVWDVSWYELSDEARLKCLVLDSRPPRFLVPAQIVTWAFDRSVFVLNFPASLSTAACRSSAIFYWSAVCSVLSSVARLRGHCLSHSLRLPKTQGLGIHFTWCIPSVWTRFFFFHDARSSSSYSRNYHYHLTLMWLIVSGSENKLLLQRFCTAQLFPKTFLVI